LRTGTDIVNFGWGLVKKELIFYYSLLALALSFVTTLSHLFSAEPARTQLSCSHRHLTQGDRTIQQEPE